MSTSVRAPRPLRPALGALVGAVLILATSLGSATAAEPAKADHARGVAPTVTDVTLITGDVVRVLTRPDGTQTVSLVAGPDGTIPPAAITRVGTHIYVVPAIAVPLLQAGKLDRDLFDVAGLIKQRYDDTHRKTLPVLVDYGQGAAATTRSVTATVDHAKKVRTIPKLATAAFAADKRQARGFWDSLTAGRDATGAPTRLADGASRVDLNGRVKALIDPNTEQIGAPTAWAAGYDGSGVHVAILDTGYDPTHPDLEGKVSKTANFSTNATVTDGNGHGTHVATTIAGTGAASGGEHGGVAPGADLWVVKVLDDTGYGDDAAVLAGMQWAVTNGADVVSMSLGGDPSDGTDPLSRAIDDLSASSDTLFVVAAGNGGNGGEAGTITAPGAAEAALTVGAVDGTDTIAWFSGRGPRTTDHALKPDVVAPGVDIVAGRAAGTSLGAPLDDYYTALSGTSMATPHVAALAAILKQEHPDWDGETLKAAIASSTVAVPGATDFDAGSGRIDAARAIATTVVSDPSVELGWYPWPNTGAPATTTPVHYTNLGDAPVTLDLAIDAEDGQGAAPSGVTLSSTHLTIPAGANATVDLAFDPAAAATGLGSGVVVATPSDGSPSVRTAFGFELESEHYDLTVQLKSRPGTQRSTHVVGLIDYGTYTYDQRTTTDAGSSSVTFRVVPGAYSVTDIGFALAGDGLVDGILTYAPSVHVTADTTVTLDAGAAKPFTYRVDRPVLNDGALLMVDWDAGDGFSGAMLGGSVDRLFATPMAKPATGFADASVDWLLSEPDATLDVGHGVVPLRAVAAPGQRPWDVSIADDRGRAKVVDAGTAAAPVTRHARRAIAMVTSPCADLGPAVSSLAAAGAVAVIAVPAAGASCAGTIAEPASIPVFAARASGIKALRAARGHRATLTSHGSPSYAYRLADWWPDRIPAGAVVDGRDRHVATFVEHYDTLGGTTAGDGVRVYDMFIGWMPGRDAAAFGLVRPVAIPGTVTQYVSPKAAWERGVQVNDRNDFALAQLWASRIAVKPRTTREDTWFAGPIHSAVSPYIAALGLDAIPNRQGDSLSLYMPELTDRAGHVGSAIYLDEFHGTLTQDGVVIMDADSPAWMWGDVPADQHAYRLTFHTARANAFWGRSTSTDTEWRFSSAHTDGLQVLPLLGLAYDLGLDDTNTAAAGRRELAIGVVMPPGVKAKALKSFKVEVSWDGGATWRTAQTRCTDPHGRSGQASASAALGLPSTTPLPGGACVAKVGNRSGGTASLRVTARDTAGHTVKQTTIGAYVVR